MDYLDSTALKSNMGRQMAKWARDTLGPKAATLGVEGFKQKYIGGGQNGWAMVHIAGVAGVTLVGNNLTHVVGGQTGYQAAQAQFDHDTGELNAGLARQAQGLGDINYAGNPHYPLFRYIDEKNAEREDDGAGTMVGDILGKMFAGKIRRGEGRAQINSLLCDK